MNRTDIQPAMVLGCHKIGLGIIRSFGLKKVPVIGVSYSKMDMGPWSKYITAHYRCPQPDQDPVGFIALLQHLGEKWNGAVLIPSDDATLIPVSKYKHVLSSIFKVASADWSVVEKCIVKKHTYSIASQIGVPCPKTLIPESMEALETFAQQTGLPCILKPTVGHRFYDQFKRKMLFIRDLTELRAAYSKMVGAGIEFMMQEFIPGGDCCGVNYNSFFIDGRPLIEVTAEKVRLSPITIGFPRVVISKWLPELSGPSSSVLKAIGYNGFSCIEFKKDTRDGIFKLMEVNARLNLSTPLSVRTGVNFPYVLYRYTLGGEIPAGPRGFKEHVFWIDIGKDFQETIRSFRKERYSITAYLRPYFGPRVFAIFSSSDLGPSFKRLLDLLNEMLTRLKIKISKRRPS